MIINVRARLSQPTPAGMQFFADPRLGAVAAYHIHCGEINREAKNRSFEEPVRGFTII